MSNEIAQITVPGTIHCGVLPKETADKIVAMQEELQDSWKKRQVFRTETEMRVSVLNDGYFPTDASKYWQCVREQTVMMDNLVASAFEYRRNEVHIRRLEAKIANEPDEFERDLAQIELEERMIGRAHLQQSAADRAREIELWSKLKSELDNGQFDTTDVNNHQMQALILQLKNRQACLTPHSNQAEVLNVIGPLSTAERVANAQGIQSAQTNRLE